MKKQISTLFAAAMLLATTLLHAQAPQGINYQAVIRNGSGAVVASQIVILQFSFNEGTAAGTTVYQETHSVTTSAYGLANVVLGNGTVVSGSFNALNWGAHPYFLKVEVNVGAGFVDLGTSQLVSVPYALHAATSADNTWAASGPHISNTNSGNVGIGTASPSAGLVVSGNGLWKAAIGIENTVGGMEWRMAVDGTNFQITKVTGSTFTPFALLSTGDVSFRNSAGTVTAYIQDNGNMGIGTTTPIAKLQIDESTGSALKVGPTSGGALGYITVNSPVGFGSTDILRIRDNGSTKMLVSRSSATYQMTLYGTAFASGGTWTNSDVKLKRDINSLGNVMPDIMKLHPTSYYFNTENEDYKYLNLPQEKQFGLLAQEVKQVFPNVVRETIEYDEAGKPRAQALHSMNYTELIPVAIKAIQEQQQMIEDLKKEIELLKSSK